MEQKIWPISSSEFNQLSAWKVGEQWKQEGNCFKWKLPLWKSSCVRCRQSRCACTGAQVSVVEQVQHPEGRRGWAKVQERVPVGNSSVYVPEVSSWEPPKFSNSCVQSWTDLLECLLKTDCLPHPQSLRFNESGVEWEKVHFYRFPDDAGAGCWSRDHGLWMTALWEPQDDWTKMSTILCNNYIYICMCIQKYHLPMEFMILKNILG